MRSSKRNETAAEKLALLQDKLRRHAMAGDDDLDELRFDIEQARIEVELEKVNHLVPE